ncbi:MAG: sugar transferase [Acidobacteria bacterium]|nr:MAG: sugar transferase [Acidobacteriota bacterium]
MIKTRNHLLSAGTVLLDLLAVLLAFLAAYGVRGSLLPQWLPGWFSAPLFPLQRYLWILAVILPGWAGLFLAFRLYSSHRLATFRRLPLDLGRANLVGMALIVGTAYLLKLQDISRTFLVLFALLNFLFLCAGRLALRGVLQHLRRRGMALRRVVILGTNREALRFARLIQRHPSWGLHLVGLVEDGDEDVAAATDDTSHPLSVLGGLPQLEEILQNQVVDEVLIARSSGTPEELEDVFLLCEDLGITARLAVGGFPHVIARAHMEEFQGRLLLTFTTQPGTLALGLKRLVDLVAGSLLLAVCAAPGLIIALLIRLGSRGPVLFVQERIGLHGRRFRMLKFRSMVMDAEGRRTDLHALNEMNGPVFKMRADPRVTTIGWFLRRTSLDELPQLLNVLRGHMALVGPRPPLPEEVSHYRRWQRRRLSMKPGITCLWQVSGRNQVDFEEWMRLDLRYIDTWSMWGDLKILLRTIPAVLSGRGAS